MDTLLDNDFKIKFDGSGHQIDANVLINNLIHVSNIIQDINRHLDGDKKIDIVIKALDKGSFLVHIELQETIIEGLKNMFTKENLAAAGTIIGALVGVIELAKFLKNGSPKEEKDHENKKTITNRDGNVMVVDKLIYNIYDKSPVVKNALAKNFEMLNSDPNITGFEITDKKEKVLVKVDKDEFEDISNIADTATSKDDRVITEKTNLVVIRPSFDNSLKWDFLYRGSKKAAKIYDADFINRVEKGEAFAKGDVLEVDLEINQAYDASLDAYRDKSFHITKIHNHIKRDEQSRIDFDL